MSSQVTFSFEGRAIKATPGQSIAAALLAAGVRQLSVSGKYRRPRGLRCGAGACPTCVLRVDGVQGVTSCTTPVRGGEQVERERPTAARLPIRRFARFAPVGFYYERFQKSPRLWAVAERVMAHLAGVSALPTADIPTGTFEERSVEVLVIGAGRDGLTQAIDMASRGNSVLVVDRDSEPGGRLLSSPDRATARRLAAEARSVGVDFLLGATAMGEFAEGVWGTTTDSGLVVIDAQRVVRATGGYDREYAFGDGDLPGVLLAGAVRRLIVRDGVVPGRIAVVAGGGEDAEEIVALLRNNGVEIAAECAPEDLVRAHGRTTVRAVTLRTGQQRPRRVRCDLVVLVLGRYRADETERIAGNDIINVGGMGND